MDGGRAGHGLFFSPLLVEMRMCSNWMFVVRTYKSLKN